MNEQKIIEKFESLGYEPVWIHNALPNEVDGEHSHSFDTKLYILSGEIKIKKLSDGAITDFLLKEGNEIDIPRSIIHEAKVGPIGCRYIVAERH